MDRKPVKSKAIASVGFEKKTRTLELEFRSGHVYQYDKVPLKLHRGLLRSKSKGRYFQKRIRKFGGKEI